MLIPKIIWIVSFSHYFENTFDMQYLLTLNVDGLMEAYFTLHFVCLSVSLFAMGASFLFKHLQSGHTNSVQTNCHYIKHHKEKM